MRKQECGSCLYALAEMDHRTFARDLPSLSWTSVWICVNIRIVDLHVGHRFLYSRSISTILCSTCLETRRWERENSTLVGSFVRSSSTSLFCYCLSMWWVWDRKISKSEYRVYLMHFIQQTLSFSQHRWSSEDMGVRYHDVLSAWGWTIVVYGLMQCNGLGPVCTRCTIIAGLVFCSIPFYVKQIRLDLIWFALSNCWIEEPCETEKKRWVIEAWMDTKHTKRSARNGKIIGKHWGLIETWWIGATVIERQDAAAAKPLILLTEIEARESEEESAVRFLLHAGILNSDPNQTRIFRMSDFFDDIDNELWNVRILSSIKLCMETDKTIVMVNTGRIHGPSPSSSHLQCGLGLIHHFSVTLFSAKSIAVLVQYDTWPHLSNCCLASKTKWTLFINQQCHWYRSFTTRSSLPLLPSKSSWSTWPYINLPRNVSINQFYPLVSLFTRVSSAPLRSPYLSIFWGRFPEIRADLVTLLCLGYLSFSSTIVSITHSFYAIPRWRGEGIGRGMQKKVGHQQHYRDESIVCGLFAPVNWDHALHDDMDCSLCHFSHSDDLLSNAI